MLSTASGACLRTISRICSMRSTTSSGKVTLYSSIVFNSVFIAEKLRFFLFQVKCCKRSCPIAWNVILLFHIALMVTKDKQFVFLRHAGKIVGSVLRNDSREKKGDVRCNRSRTYTSHNGGARKHIPGTQRQCGNALV